MNLVPFTSELIPTQTRLLDRNLLNFRNEVDNVMNSFFTSDAVNFPKISGVGYTPAVDIKEKEGKYLLEAEVPGMTEKEIELDLSDNVLTIKGERHSDYKEEREGYYHSERMFGTFRRDIPFYDEVNPEKVKADLKNGILHIEVEKKEGKSKTHKKIKINS